MSIVRVLVDGYNVCPDGRVSLRKSRLVFWFVTLRLYIRTIDALRKS